ncbi:hypothetical protein ANCDUO_04206 [Ancylostoma duodenale]|uniref:Reverse transcriptase domain-containing protein n=1 Tax=Ancylostoma duodenale TaxID=51022 RepID=A0A0C2D769_9BILA|nr:hypothetical protein ANCDUO_04206 [Ancylostoma duodenale]
MKVRERNPDDGIRFYSPAENDSGEGFRLNLKKTEVMSSTQEQDVVSDANGIAFTQAKEFQYLGSVLSADGTVDAAVRGWIACAWLKRRESTGILCDRRCSRVLKGKIYRTVVRPAMMYGGECWPLLKTHERMLNTAEMRMLRWACGLARYDKMAKGLGEGRHRLQEHHPAHSLAVKMFRTKLKTIKIVGEGKWTVPNRSGEHCVTEYLYM